jgi:hypothetical protein
MPVDERHEPVLNICESKEAQSHLGYFPGLERRVCGFCEHIQRRSEADPKQKQGASDGEYRPLVEEDSVSRDFRSIQPAKGEECCICLQSLEVEAEGEEKMALRSCVATRCGHFYHPTCLSDAFTRVPSHSCPSKFCSSCSLPRVILVCWAVSHIHRPITK